MKILILGGMHGNEPLGIQLVHKLMQNPIPGVDAILINKNAVLKNRRFIVNDIQRLFPGDINDKDYELKRAAEIIKICKKYDLTLDFHNTSCPDNDCSFIGKSANTLLLAVSILVGLKRTVVVDYDCLNKYAPNCISIEISMNSKNKNINNWYNKIIKLSKMKNIATTKKIDVYRYVYEITLEDRDRLQLLEIEKSLKPFKKIAKELAMKLGVKSPAYPIFINDDFTPDNFGGILNKCDMI